MNGDPSPCLSQTLTALRGLIYQEPGRKGWLSICAALASCPPSARQVAADYLQPGLDRWVQALAQAGPASVLRLAPPLDWVQRWLEAPEPVWMGLIRALDLSRVACTPQQADALLAHPALDKLRALSLGGQRTSASLLLSMARRPHLETLRYLGCRRCNMPSEAGLALADLGRRLSALRGLDLEQNLLEDRAVEALASVEAWTALARLNLRSNQAGRRSALALARAAHLEQLRHLELSLNLLGDQGVAALVQAPWLPGLRALSLTRNQLTADCAGDLAAARAENLRHLALGWNRLGHQGLVDLLRAPWLPGLRALDLTDNQVGDRGALALASAHGMDQLQRLDLRYNQITDEGVASLAAAPHLASLRELRLEGNRITREGVELLLGSPFLCEALRQRLRRSTTEVLRSSRW
jgi:Ran GTPase-activating protein (RanGAP) involved in mRNA processing and transport